MKMSSRLCSAAALVLLIACRKAAPPEAIDQALATRVPMSAVVLSGVDLDRLRTSPLYGKLPPAAQAFLTPLAKAQRALIASDGRAFLVIARGEITGGTRAGVGISLFGAPGLIAAAQSGHSAAAILTPAARVASEQAVWIAIRGGVRLPLSGDLDNFNNLLREVDWLTMILQPSDPVALEVRAECPTQDAAVHWEQTVRALVSMSTATTRDTELAGALQGMRLERTEGTVRATLTMPADMVGRFGQ